MGKKEPETPRNKMEINSVVRSSTTPASLERPRNAERRIPRFHERRVFLRNFQLLSARPPLVKPNVSGPALFDLSRDRAPSGLSAERIFRHCFGRFAVRLGRISIRVDSPSARIAFRFRPRSSEVQRDCQRLGSSKNRETFSFPRRGPSEADLQARKAGRVPSR